MSMIEITNRDRSRWQMRAALALVDLLSRVALPADLPPLAWRVDGLGLRAEVPPAVGRRSEYDEWLMWVDALELRVEPRQHGTGTVYLRASGQWRPRGSEPVRVSVHVQLSQETAARVL